MIKCRKKCFYKIHFLIKITRKAYKDWKIKTNFEISISGTEKESSYGKEKQTVLCLKNNNEIKRKKNKDCPN